MHIGIVGPIATADIAGLLDRDTANLPQGYAGAPLLASLIKELLERGHSVTAFTLSSDMALIRGKSIYIQNGRFGISYSPMRPRAWRPNGLGLGRIVDLYRFERHNLQRAIEKASPEVLHAHWVYEFSLAALATKIPSVVTCHDSPLTIARMYSKRRITISAYRWLRVLMALKVLKEASTVTVVSPYMSDQIASLTSQKIQIVPNPVDNLAFRLSRTRQSPVIPRIAMVCNGWDARKNPEPGLRAFASFRKLVPSAEMHLFGNDFGPNQKAEQWCVGRSLHEGVVFHGSVSHQTLLRNLATLDVLLHTSIEESFGLVLAEAMAMGIPVVAGISSGAVPWVVGEYGELCDVTDPEKIRQALANVLISGHYGELSKKGIESVEKRFSTSRVVDQLDILYRHAADNAP